MTLSDLVITSVIGAGAALGAQMIGLRSKNLEIGETEKSRLMRRIGELETRVDARETYWKSREEECQSRVDALESKLDAMEETLKARLVAQDEDCQKKIRALTAENEDLQAQVRALRRTQELMQETIIKEEREARGVGE